MRMKLWISSHINARGSLQESISKDAGEIWKVLGSIIFVDICPFCVDAIFSNALVVYPETVAVLPLGIACIPALKSSIIRPSIQWQDVISTVYANPWLSHLHHIKARGSMQESISVDTGELWMINCAVILVDVSPFFGAAISADASVVHPVTPAVLPFVVACIPALEMFFIKELLWSVLSTVYAKRWLCHFYRINAWGSPID